MGLRPEQLDEHTRVILGSPRIRGKLVVLCEGERSAPADRNKRPSPQTYRKQERFPDASFYRSCVPMRRWQNRGLPCFFNCGDRHDVLQTFARLLELHREQPSRSFLDPDRLYAIIDLDLQPSDLAHSPCSTTEELYEALYERGTLRIPVDDDHRIWVTALVHKEAYFMLPSVADVLVSHYNRPELGGKPLQLATLHRAAARSLSPDPPETDRDLQRHFPVAQRRLGRFALSSPLDTSTSRALSHSWLTAFDDVDADDPLTETLVLALFTVTKAKPHWTRIEPPSDGSYTDTPAQYRGQLALAIGQHIASLPPQGHPIAGFIEHLRARR